MNKPTCILRSGNIFVLTEDPSNKFGPATVHNLTNGAKKDVSNLQQVFKFNPYFVDSSDREYQAALANRPIRTIKLHPTGE